MIKRNCFYYIENWYWGFMLQGAIVLGLAPILIPIIVADKSGPLAAGSVVAAFYLGQLASPVFGILADKYNLYRTLYLASYLVMGVSAAGFVWAENEIFWFLLALIIGLSAGAGNTISAMYVVEVTPHDEWDSRIGWLQTFYGSGQALGLFAAAMFAADAGGGMVFAGVMMLPGVILSRSSVPDMVKSSSEQIDRNLHHHVSRRSRSVLAPFHHYQAVSLLALKKFLRSIRSWFGLYILSWFLVTFGMWMFMNLYPLLMLKSYDISAGKSSTYYAAFATVGAFVYAPSGSLGRKIGNARVVFIGVLMLLLSLLALSVLCYVGKEEWQLLVPLAFAMIPVAWSPLIVGGTALASELTPFGQGEGLGIFNAATALSSVIAAFAAGFIAHTWSYQVVTATAGVAVIFGVIVFCPLLKAKKPY